MTPLISSWPPCASASSRSAKQREIGFSKPLGDYSETEALRVIDAIVTRYTEAMVEHHEASKFPPVRGMPPAPDPLAILRRSGRRSAVGGEAMMDFNSSSSISGQLTALIDAGMQLERARQSVRQYLGASRLGTSCERALQYEFAQAPVDHVRDIQGRILRIFERDYVNETSMVAWLRDAGFDLRTHHSNGEQFGSPTPMAACGAHRRRDCRWPEEKFRYRC